MEESVPMPTRFPKTLRPYHAECESKLAHSKCWGMGRGLGRLAGLCGGLECVLEAHRADLFQLVFLQAHPRSVGIFAAQRGSEQRRVVGRKDNRYPLAEEFRQRMILDSHVIAPQLANQSACSDIALRANFERNSPVGEQIHQSRILDRRNSVSNAFHAEQFDGFADFLRSAHFACIGEGNQVRRPPDG